MATISQVQRGFVRFIDNDVAVAFEGWQKAVVAGGAGLVASNLPNLVKVYGSSPIVAATGLYDSNSATINIDALYNAVVPKLGQKKYRSPFRRSVSLKSARKRLTLSCAT